MRCKVTALPTISAWCAEAGARLRMFRLGVDECVSSDMDEHEISARARSLARRLGYLPDLDHLAVGPVTIDLGSREVIVRGELIELTAKEFDLLAYLAAHPGTVYRREQLLATVWHSSIEWQQTATVTEHVRRLRTKLESDPGAPELLRTVRGVGYTLDRRGAERCQGHGTDDLEARRSVRVPGRGPRQPRQAQR